MVKGEYQYVVFSVLVVALWASITWAGNEPSDFKGLRFGEDLTQSVSKCSQNWTSTNTPCWKQDAWGKFELHGGEFNQVGDIQLSTLSATQRDARLEKISATFQTEDFGELLKILKARYGSPTKTFYGTQQAIPGVTLSGQFAIWEGKKIKITMLERALHFHDTRYMGMLVYQTIEDVRRDQQQEQERIKKGVKGL